MGYTATRNNRIIRGRKERISSRKTTSARKIIFSGSTEDLKTRFPEAIFTSSPTIGITNVRFNSSNITLLRRSTENNGKLKSVVIQVAARYYQDGILIRPGIYEFQIA